MITKLIWMSYILISALSLSYSIQREKMTLLMMPTLIGSFPSYITLNSSTSLNTSARLRFPLSSSVAVRSGMASPSTSSSGISTLPNDRIILGVGGVTLDYLATVASYPEPDDKIRSTDMKVQGGGNAGNALTCASRLGLVPRLISKVANDGQGRGMLEELEADGVDTSFLVVSKEGNSPFTYIIVDNQTYVCTCMIKTFMPEYGEIFKILFKTFWTSLQKTRTCIHTPGFPPMIPEDLPQSSLVSSLDGASLLYLDGRLHESALVVALEAMQRNIPILIDAEKKREGLDELLNLSDYVVCSAKFPQAWTEASSIPSALLSMLVRLPRLKFVIVTLGEDGCIMLERSATENTESEETGVDDLLELLMLRKDVTTNTPTCISSVVTKMQANDIGMITGTLYVCTTEEIPFSELIDTTGAGDAFIGAVLYAICAKMPPTKMLPFACTVAAANCRALGARGALPHRSDPRLACFL